MRTPGNLVFTRKPGVFAVHGRREGSGGPMIKIKRSQPQVIVIYN